MPGKTHIELAESNLALFGTDVEKKIKQNAAEKEVAWQVAGKQIGVEVWRIEKFKVVLWPKERYGEFYTGDSYIVLNTFKKEACDLKFSYVIHFWLGKETSQDEAGTAAYKTVELDDHFKGIATQCRQVQGYESSQFLDLFPHVKLLQGGVESGFRHVTVGNYVPRLLHVKGRGKCVKVTEVEKSTKSLNSGDVFILDNGKQIIQWNGKDSNGMERHKAAEVSAMVESEHSGHVSVVSTINDQFTCGVGEGDSDCAEFFKLLGGVGPIAAATPDDVSHIVPKKLFRLSAEAGSASFKDQGQAEKKKLDSNDVFVLDSGDQVYVWVGKNASVASKKKSMLLAHEYLNKEKRPFWLPVSRIVEGNESPAFARALE